MLSLLISLYFGFLPVPALVWTAAFVERKRLHVDVEKQELYDRLSGKKPWKSKILHTRNK